jgi:hypothetical protein
MFASPFSGWGVTHICNVEIPVVPSSFDCPSSGLATPGDDRDPRLRIENLDGPSHQTVALEHVLGRLRWNLREDGASARQADAGRSRKVEGIKPELKEETKYVCPAGHRDRALDQTAPAASL